MKCSNQNALARARKAPVQTDDARREGSCQGKFGILEKRKATIAMAESANAIWCRVAFFRRRLLSGSATKTSATS